MPEGLREGGPGSKEGVPPSFSVSMVTPSCPARICVSNAEMGCREAQEEMKGGRETKGGRN